MTASSQAVFARPGFQTQFSCGKHPASHETDPPAKGFRGSGNQAGGPQMKAVMKTMFRSMLFASVATATCLTVPGFAFAQQKPTNAAASADVSEIVVTGSHIRRDTFDSPLPIASVNSDQIRQSGNVTLGDILNDLPQLDISSTSQNTSNTLFQSGQARVN